MGVGWLWVLFCALFSSFIVACCEALATWDAEKCVSRIHSDEQCLIRINTCEKHELLWDLGFWLHGPAGVAFKNLPTNQLFASQEGPPYQILLGIERGLLENNGLKPCIPWPSQTHQLVGKNQARQDRLLQGVDGHLTTFDLACRLADPGRSSR